MNSSPLWPEPDPRTLKVEFLWSSRSYRGPRAEWDLPRGFRVMVVQPGWFAFFLGSRALSCEDDPLSLAPAPHEEAFLLGLPPLDAGGEWLSKGRSCLEDLAWPVGVVALLGDFRERSHLATLRRRSGQVFANAFGSGAAFWVWQPMPWPRRQQGLAFLAVEQQLYQWGRVGRHVRRHCRLRRLWPW